MVERLSELPLEYSNKSTVQAVDSVSNGLTGIPESIHCPATQNSGGSNTHELDQITIENFLDALAQVAISVAARRTSKRQSEDG